MRPTALSLFAGGGGLDLGARIAGFDVIASIERDPHACATLSANLGHEVVQADATLVDYSRWSGVDLIMGGPPCQGHSVANSRRVGLERNDLVWEMLRAAREARPRAVLMENVATFDRTLLARVCADLGRLGYWVTAETLNAADYGVPQSRRRLFVLASRSWHQWPDPTTARKHGTINEALRGLEFRPAPFPAWLIRKGVLPSWRLVDAQNANKRGAQGRAGTRPAPTMVASCYYHRVVTNGEVGMLGPRGMARFQAFPDDYAFSGNVQQQSVQIGNAVPPPLAAAITGVLA